MRPPRKARPNDAMAPTIVRMQSSDGGPGGPSGYEVLDKVSDAGERWLGKFSPRVQAQIMIGAGMLVTAAAWALLPFQPQLLAAKSRALNGMMYIVLAVGPSLLVYGLLRSLVPAVPAPPVGSRFGDVLVEADAEQRWKHRLLAVGIGIVHVMVYSAMR